VAEGVSKRTTRKHTHAHAQHTYARTRTHTHTHTQHTIAGGFRFCENFILLSFSLGHPVSIAMSLGNVDELEALLATAAATSDAAQARVAYESVAYSELAVSGSELDSRLSKAKETAVQALADQCVAASDARALGALLARIRPSLRTMAMSKTSKIGAFHSAMAMFASDALDLLV